MLDCSVVVAVTNGNVRHLFLTKTEYPLVSQAAGVGRYVYKS